jgi:hypothetical protein
MNNIRRCTVGTVCHFSDKTARFSKKENPAMETGVTISGDQEDPSFLSRLRTLSMSSGSDEAYRTVSPVTGCTNPSVLA